MTKFTIRKNPNPGCDFILQINLLGFNSKKIYGIVGYPANFLKYFDNHTITKKNGTI